MNAPLNANSTDIDARKTLLAVLMGLLVFLFFPPHASAVDQQLTSTTYATGYSIRAADGSFLDRRNIVEDLHFTVWNLLPGSSELYYKGPRLSLEFDLRLAGDYGVGNGEMSPRRLDQFVPGVAALDAEAVFAYLQIHGLFNDHVDVRLGRQIRIDTIGYTSFDGADTTIYWPAAFSLSGFVGYEVKGAKPFGYDSLELDGVDNVGRNELDSEYFESLYEPESIFVVGAELSWAPNRVVDSAVAVRVAGLLNRLQQQTVAGRLAIGNEKIRTFARVVMNPLLDRYENFIGALREGTLVTESSAEVAVQVTRKSWLSVGYELFRPVFMLDSIFNIFGQMGRRDLITRYEYQVNIRLQLASWSFIRLVDNTEVHTSAEQARNVVGGGGGAGVNYRTHTKRLASRIQIENELNAIRFGVEHELGRRVFDEKMLLSLRSSFWHIDDIMYGNSKNIAGYVLSANHQFSQKARALFEFENYYGSGTPRFVVTALLQLDVWR